MDAKRDVSSKLLEQILKNQQTLARQLEITERVVAQLTRNQMNNRKEEPSENEQPRRKFEAMNSKETEMEFGHQSSPRELFSGGTWSCILLQQADMCGIQHVLDLMPHQMDAHEVFDEAPVDVAWDEDLQQVLDEYGSLTQPALERDNQMQCKHLNFKAHVMTENGVSIEVVWDEEIVCAKQKQVHIQASVGWDDESIHIIDSQDSLLQQLAHGEEGFEAVCSVFDERPQLDVLWDEEMQSDTHIHDGLLQQLASGQEYCDSVQMAYLREVIWDDDDLYSDLHIQHGSVQQSAYLVGEGSKLIAESVIDDVLTQDNCSSFILDAGIDVSDAEKRLELKVIDDDKLLNQMECGDSENIKWDVMPDSSLNDVLRQHLDDDREKKKSMGELEADAISIFVNSSPKFLESHMDTTDPTNLTNGVADTGKQLEGGSSYGKAQKCKENANFLLSDLPYIASVVFDGTPNLSSEMEWNVVFNEYMAHDTATCDSLLQLLVGCEGKSVANEENFISEQVLHNISPIDSGKMDSTQVSDETLNLQLEEIDGYCLVNWPSTRISEILSSQSLNCQPTSLSISTVYEEDKQLLDSMRHCFSVKQSCPGILRFTSTYMQSDMTSKPLFMHCENQFFAKKDLSCCCNKYDNEDAVLFGFFDTRPWDPGVPHFQSLIEPQVTCAMANRVQPWASNAFSPGRIEQASKWCWEHFIGQDFGAEEMVCSFGFTSPWRGNAFNPCRNAAISKVIQLHRRSDSLICKIQSVKIWLQNGFSTQSEVSQGYQAMLKEMPAWENGGFSPGICNHQHEVYMAATRVWALRWYKHTILLVMVPLLSTWWHDRFSH